jgi:O-antigen/teichoic acid export membrane protein
LELSKEILNVSFKNLIPAISNRFGANADKIAIFLVLGKEASNNYNLICRIPQLMQELVARITEVITPEMTHTAQNDEKNFTPIFLRNFSITSGVVASSIFVVSAFGESLLAIWTDRQIEHFGVLCFMMSIYFGLEAYHSIITRGFYAFNKTHFLLPFTLWNSVITLLFSKALAKKFGLIGIAGMNVFIDVTQIIPLHWFAAKLVLRDVSAFELLKRSLKVIVPCLLVCIPIVWVTTTFHSKNISYFFVFLTPIVSLSVLASLIRLELIETTENFVKIMRKIPGVRLIVR